MPQLTPIPFALAQEKARSSKIATATLTNLYASKAPNSAKAPAALYGTPGTALWKDMGSPVRGMGVHDGRLIVVTEDGISELNADATVNRSITPQTKIATRADVASMGTAACVVGGGRVWIITELGITDKTLRTDYPHAPHSVYPANRVAVLDNYFILNREGTGQFYFTGPLVTEYNQNFEALDFATAEGAPDDTLAVLADHRELWLFGEHTVEVWYNAGGEDPFQRIQGAFIEHGCASPWVPAKEDNTVYWLTDDGIVMSALNYSPMRISTDEVEAELATVQSDFSAALGWTYSEAGHVFYMLTVGGLTLCFDAATRLWHKRSHLDLGRHAGTSYARFASKHLIGTDEGQVLEMSTSLYADYDAPLVSIVDTGNIHAGRRKVRMMPFEAEVEAGHGATWSLAWSDNGGKTYSSWHTATAGAVGDHGARLRWHRLGAARDRRFRLSTSDNAPRALLSTGWLGIG